MWHKAILQKLGRDLVAHHGFKMEPYGGDEGQGMRYRCGVVFVDMLFKCGDGISMNPPEVWVGCEFDTNGKKIKYGETTKHLLRGLIFEEISHMREVVRRQRKRAA